MVVREDWGWTPTGWTPRIAYRLADGREIVREPKRSFGQPPELLGYDECIPKYRGCVDALVAAPGVERSIALVRDLERCSDVGDVMRAVAWH